MNLKLTLFSISLIFTNLLSYAEENGETLFAQMCAACHGANGQGVGNGVFPPLDGSEWLRGDENRIAQIMYHGLKGPVTVKGKVYNLAMPAQGSLSDKGKLAVIHYIKEKFAGEKSNYTLEDLLKTKKKFESRTEQWTKDKLLAVYPLPERKSPITNLIMQVYHGDKSWRRMPDFSKLSANGLEEENSGYISLEKINKKFHFAVRWQGDLNVEKDGNYLINLQANDGAAIFINDDEVARLKGFGSITPKRISTKKIYLKKGSHKIRVEYFQFKDSSGIAIKWTDLSINDKRKASQWLTDVSAHRRPAPVIDLTPKNGRTRLYYNFIAGSTHRTMGVGFPFKNNIAFSTRDCQPDVIWTGSFINAGKHWTNRGQGPQKPLSNEVVNLGQGVAWSKDDQALDIKLTGYTMDKTGNPTFSYKSKATGIVFSEKYDSSVSQLTRIITINSPNDQLLQLRLAKNKHTIQDTVAHIDGKLMIEAPYMESSKEELSTPVKLNKGNNTFKIKYSWKK